MRKKEVTIVDLGINNIKKIVSAFEFLDANVKIAKNKNDISKASKLILPGLGAFKSGMNNLNKMGIIDDLYEFVFAKKKTNLWNMFRYAIIF